MTQICVGTLEELDGSARKVVALGDLEIGIFRIDDGIVAWENKCPHMGGPVCQGGLFKRVVDVLDEERRDIRQDHHPRDVNIVCPWHGVEFDLRTGRVPAMPEMRLNAIPISVRDGKVFVDVQQS